MALKEHECPGPRNNRDSTCGKECSQDTVFPIRGERRDSTFYSNGPSVNKLTLEPWMDLNFAECNDAYFVVFAGKVLCGLCLQIVLHCKSHKVSFLAQLPSRARLHTKQTTKPDLASGDFHNSVEIASTLMIPHKCSKIETQKDRDPHPASTQFTSSFVFMCLLLGALDLRRVLILPGNL